MGADTAAPSRYDSAIEINDETSLPLLDPEIRHDNGEELGALVGTDHPLPTRPLGKSARLRSCDPTAKPALQELEQRVIRVRDRHETDMRAVSGFLSSDDGKDDRAFAVDNARDIGGLDSGEADPSAFTMSDPVASSFQASHDRGAVHLHDGCDLIRGVTVPVESEGDDPISRGKGSTRRACSMPERDAPALEAADNAADVDTVALAQAGRRFTPFVPVGDLAPFCLRKSIVGRTGMDYDAVSHDALRSGTVVRSRHPFQRVTTPF